MLDFDQTLELIGDGRRIDIDRIKPQVLERRVWVAEWHLPGCLSESQVVVRSKDDAVRAACDMASGEGGPPRGLAAALHRFGRADSHSPMFGLVINTVTQLRVRDLL